MQFELFFLLHSFSFVNPFLDGLIIFSAKYFGYIVVALLIGVLLYKTKSLHKTFILGGVSILSGLIARSIAEVLKVVTAFPRPFVTFDMLDTLLKHEELFRSFPSGHTVFFVGLSASLYFYNKRLSILFGIFGLIIGISRIIAGIHWPIDIIVGAVIGIITGGIISFVLRIRLLNA